MERVLVVSVLVGALMAAGCLSADPAGRGERSATTAGPEGETPVPRDPAGRVALAFPGSVHEDTFTVSGTFYGTQFGDTAADTAEGLGADTGSLRRHDISDRMVYGMPSVVTITVDVALQHGDLDIDLEVPQGRLWHVHGVAPAGGFTSLSYHLTLGSGPVSLTVYYDEPEPTPTFDYEVTVLVEADPAVVPSPVGVRVELGSADVLNVARVEPNDRRERLYAWGPGGTFLEALSVGAGILRLEAGDWGAGVYTLAAAPAAGPLKLHLEDREAAVPPTLEMATVRIEEYGPYEDATIAEGAFDAPGPPLYLQALLVGGLATDGTATLQVTFPSGQIVEASDTFTAAPVNVVFWSSEWLDVRASAGTWAVRGEAPTHVGPDPLQLRVVAAYVDLGGRN